MDYGIKSVDTKTHHIKFIDTENIDQGSYY